MNTAIKKIIQYGIEKGLITELDIKDTVNAFLELFKLNEYLEPEEEYHGICLDEVLNEMLDYAYQSGMIKENSIVYRDMFETKIMEILAPRPSDVIDRFWQLYKESPKDATDYFYKLSRDINYIRGNRIAKDFKWVTQTEYGEINIIINTNEEEKGIQSSEYQKCLLCNKSKGNDSTILDTITKNHCMIPIQLKDLNWEFQYSQYIDYQEHCIIVNSEQIPIRIDKSTFANMFEFIKLFPHYFIGSNADLTIVGGPMPANEHFIGGINDFALAKAKIEGSFIVKGFEDVELSIVKWPMSVIRVSAKQVDRLIEIGDYILNKWRNYTDQSVFIFATKDGESYNTITPIARKTPDMFQLDLVLRNNITTVQHPYGVFHPHEELHHIKKDNIGLIEVMGLAVLPPNLADEMQLLEEYIITGKDILSNEMISKHFDWVNDFRIKYPDLNAKNIQQILQTEISNLFLKVLEHAGVFKRNKKGQDAFIKFIRSLSEE